MTDWTETERALDAYCEMKVALCADKGGPTDLVSLLECATLYEPVVAIVPGTDMIEAMLRDLHLAFGPFRRVRFLSEVYLRMFESADEARSMARGDLRAAHEEGDMRVAEALSAIDFGPGGEVEVMLWRRTAYDDRGQPTWPDGTEVMPVSAEGHLVSAVRRALA